MTVLRYDQGVHEESATLALWSRFQYRIPHHTYSIKYLRWGLSCLCPLIKILIQDPPSYVLN